MFNDHAFFHLSYASSVKCAVGKMYYYYLLLLIDKWPVSDMLCEYVWCSLRLPPYETRWISDLQAHF